MLLPGKLVYFKSPQSASPAGMIEIDQDTTLKIEGVGAIKGIGGVTGSKADDLAAFSICPALSSRTYMLVAENQHQRKVWLDIISFYISDQTKQNQEQTSKEGRTGTGSEINKSPSSYHRGSWFESTLLVQKGKDKNKWQRRHVALFSYHVDIFDAEKPSGRVHDSIPLTHSCLIKIVTPEEVDPSFPPYLFSIQSSSHDASSPLYLFGALNERQREDWIILLLQANHRNPRPGKGSHLFQGPTENLLVNYDEMAVHIIPSTSTSSSSTSSSSTHASSSILSAMKRAAKKGTDHSISAVNILRVNRSLMDNRRLVIHTPVQASNSSATTLSMVESEGEFLSTGKNHTRQRVSQSLRGIKARSRYNFMLSIL